MVELITITEGFYACGVAASVYGKADPHSHSFVPDAVFSNIGKLLLATKIYDMHRIAHYVSGGLIVTLPGPDEDHNPETSAKVSDVLRANPDVPYAQRIETARFIEDLTAGYQGGWYSVISLHGGGSPAAMKQEIYRNYPIGSKVELVERLLERGIAADIRDPAIEVVLVEEGGLPAIGLRIIAPPRLWHMAELDRVIGRPPCAIGEARAGETGVAVDDIAPIARPLEQPVGIGAGPGGAGEV
jgi:hypothetical protein